MDACSSGEEVVVKTRKPYTITKQRERWSDEEHNRFLEALKLYGRAWQRIEEHIGTKTAVQIRSHAQKFFSKLEKEALVKGISIGQALDIEIPPPRPKRKPINPYPRKTNVSSPTINSGSNQGKLLISAASPHGKEALDLEKEPPPENNEDERPTTVNESTDENCSKTLTIIQEAPCSSVSSANKSSISVSVPLTSSCALREFRPSVKEVVTRDETSESFVTIEVGNQKLEINGGKDTQQSNFTSNASKLESSDASQAKSVQIEKTDCLNCALTIDGMQGNPNFPRHISVQVVDGNHETSTQNPSQDKLFGDSMFHPVEVVSGQHNLFTISDPSNTSENQSNDSQSSIHQSFLHCPPFSQHNHDDYQSFLQMSSTLSNLIVSTLLQNPAAHAAASFAATFWPYANNLETSSNSPVCPQGAFASRQVGSPLSVAAIAAATVAAATSWWAAHGMLPLCAPLHTAFPCPPSSAVAVQSINVGEAPPETKQGEITVQNPPREDQMLHPEYSKAQQAQQHSPSKLLVVSPSESEESGVTKLNASSKATNHGVNHAISEHVDSNKIKGKIPVDHSSCGSNTGSSSEETDALEKDEKEKEEPEPETHAVNHLAADPSNRCATNSRSFSYLTDSWKEVSEEGRLAFQALFSRQVLPQSFSPPQDIHYKNEEDLESKKCSSNSKPMQKSLSSVENNTNSSEEGLLTIGLGHGRLKTRRTGFKPYKRCSVEANENKVGNQGEEKCPKRIRIEGEAPI
ncbi:putative transcription factor MYB-HB-like family [Lupinus albus]|uniref:Putative transcription factor MYB-HB-like family n=1 Tax=Lupinus albus TaxID=3870 RepID=A0A6A4P5R3_LUPAL|nr:putative transcription factor MYB-HB-like family [Lupinus albus]